MSRQGAPEPEYSGGADAADLLIKPHEKDIGGLTVRRVLPSPERRTVGPYVFFDHIGPAHLPPGRGIDVRPHPHIGLSTVTYLFEGEILHRDSLSYVQPIRPGAVNLMTAGRGIVHSERTAPEERERDAQLHGIQLWLALPADLEETDPAFTHYPVEVIPSVDAGSGVRVTVVMGEAYGTRSPVATLSPTLYAEAVFAVAGRLPVTDAYAERAVFVVSGQIAVGRTVVQASEMCVIRAGAEAVLAATGPARAMIIGGEPFPEPRTVWWNFVSSDKARIEQAKSDWQAGRFPGVPGESEFIPLPE